MDIDEDNCCHINRPTLKNENFPSPYIHLGWATSEEELKQKFQQQTGYSTGELEIVQVYHKRNPLKFSCDIHTTELCLQAKCTVIYKKNDCVKHAIIVIAIVERAVVSGELLDWLKGILWQSVFPRVSFISEGHDSISEDSRRAALLAINKRKKSSTGITEDEKEELINHYYCHCNGQPSQPTGGFATWGCTLKKVGKPVCKFNIKTATGRKKFHLKNLKENDSVIESLCQTLADVVSDRCLVLAPLAAKNMLEEASNGPLCRLGNRHKMFAAMSLNSSFRIHSHVDKKDFPNGITGLINVHRNEGEPGQLHILVDYALTEEGNAGIAFDLGSGSLLLEAASREWHASTKPICPSLQDPTRAALVFFSHAGLNRPDHGFE
jgi:hypothetical protein